MTKEEAAEELLRADPYVKCLDCDGEGFISGGDAGPFECKTCFTAGKLTRRKFIQACVLLDTYPWGCGFTRAVAEDQ
jgi:DnaJ-class molecular chaperone